MTQLAMFEEWRWSKKRGLHRAAASSQAALGTYQRMWNRRWRQRVKRDGRHTWVLKEPSDGLIKRIKVEALLLGVQL